jgi:hypothetical protein
MMRPGGSETYVRFSFEKRPARKINLESDFFGQDLRQIQSMTACMNQIASSWRHRRHSPAGKIRDLQFGIG